MVKNMKLLISLNLFLGIALLGTIPFLYSMNVEPYQELKEHIQGLITNLPMKPTEGIALTREFLIELKDLLTLCTETRCLKDVLQRIGQIKEFTQSKSYKGEKVASSLYGDISLEQFGNFILEELLKNVERIGKIARPSAIRGLVNPMSEETGNRCFMNAALQSLYGLSKFNEVILNKENTEYYKPLSISDLYIKFIRLITRSSEPLVDLFQLCVKGWENLQRTAGTPQDSIEFIQMLLDHLITEDIDPAKTEDKENVEVKSLFTFELHPQRVGFQHLKEEPFMLNLPIENCDHLIDCLNAFFELEEVEYESQTQPRVTLLHKTGKYFLITLKRKLYDVESKTYKRILKPIAFPWQDLDLTKYSDRSTSIPLYGLKAIIIHSGSAEGGHYTAYVLHNNQWYFCNDTSIKPIKIEEIKSIAKQGYGTDKEQLPVMLFYEAQT